MYDKSLRVDENVRLIEVAPVDTLSSTVSATTHMKHELSVVRKFVITIEGTDEHWASAQILVASCRTISFHL